VDNSSEYYGGAVYILYGYPLLLDSCAFFGNSAGSGGAIYATRGPNLVNCVFAHNSAQYGAGIYDGGEQLHHATNCTFFANTASVHGGGIYYDTDYPYELYVTNSILWADQPEEVYIHDGEVLVSYSDIQGGWPGDGNMDAAPLWVDPDNGDYHLSPGSPCIDTGTNDAPYLPDYDFEGDDRIMDGDGDTVAIVDMGVDEYLPSAEDTIHVGGMEGYFSLDDLGRPVLRAHVYIEDEDLNPLPHVAVEAAVTVPCGGPYVRMRYTKPSGNARFDWGCNQSGTWTLCVEDLVLEGYVYVPDDNVVICKDWEN
jgi:predicted outer membrane repeat protein